MAAPPQSGGPAHSTPFFTAQSSPSSPAQSSRFSPAECSPSADSVFFHSKTSSREGMAAVGPMSDSVFLHSQTSSSDRAAALGPTSDSVFLHSQTSSRGGAADPSPMSDSVFLHSQTSSRGGAADPSPMSDSVFLHSKTFTVDGSAAPSASSGSAFRHSKTFTADGTAGPNASSDSVFLHSKTFTVDGTATPAQLQEENALLRCRINDLEIMTATQAEKIMMLEKSLEENKIKEEKQALDLESIEKYVEHTLELMTKQRVARAEEITKLKQENALLQAELRDSRQGRALEVGQAELPMDTQGAEAALQHLCRITANCRDAVRQLLSEAETLQLVIEILKSIERFSAAS